MTKEAHFTVRRIQNGKLDKVPALALFVCFGFPLKTGSWNRNQVGEWASVTGPLYYELFTDPSVQV